MNVWNAAIWIRVHWFELAALALLSANLWFAFGILSVLRAMNDALVFLGARSDRGREESAQEMTGQGGMSTHSVMERAHPLLINVALALLSWALLVLIIVAIRAAIL